MCQLLKNINSAELSSLFGGYLKQQSTDCILYSNDGNEFKIHKEVLGQTAFMRGMLNSIKDGCCSKIEIICPCSKEEISKIVHFMYYGEILCEDVFESFTIQEDLNKIFGFPESLNLNDQIAMLLKDPTLSSILNDIEFEDCFEESKMKLRKDTGVYFEKKDSTNNQSQKVVTNETKQTETIEHHPPCESNTNRLMNAERNSIASSVDLSDIKEIEQEFALKGKIQMADASYISLADAEVVANNIVKSGLFTTDQKSGEYPYPAENSLGQCMNLPDESNKNILLDTKRNSSVLSIDRDETLEKGKMIDLHNNAEVDDSKVVAGEVSNINQTLESNAGVTGSLLQKKKDRSLLTHEVDEIKQRLRNKPFSCEYCQQTRRNKTSMERHLNKIHLGRKPKLHLNRESFSCKYCNYSCLTRDVLKNHVNGIHLKLKKFKCNQCEGTFFNKKKFQHHLDTVHLLNQESYKCNDCGCQFKNARGLKTHSARKKHWKVKECYKCNIHFESQIDLKRHMNSAHQ